jgi:hypothetical protein
MSRAIRIIIGEITFEADLNDTSTAQAVHEALPIEGEVSRWGDEVYFLTEIEGDAAEADRDEMGIGELAYWPPGKAFCIFWGPTPASIGDEPRAASNVVPIGRLTGDIAPLADTAAGQSIRIESA